MRIAISNSDSIGDFVLRQPMFAALSQAGHELALVVRSFVAPLAQWVAPGAQIIHLIDDPYSPSFNATAPSVQQAIASVKSFAPQIYGIVQYQRTAFEELLAESLPEARVFAVDGKLYQNLDSGVDTQSRLRPAVWVPVSVDSHELRKNELLCAALLQKNLTLPPPSLPLHSGDQDSAQARLAQLGLEPGGYWIGCVGDGLYKHSRNWTLEGWAKVFTHCVTELGWRLLLVGTPDESESTEKVRHLMGEARISTFNCCDSRDGLDTLTSLVAMSSGYVGRDTGPMHLAAAFGKPVVAVFGGGNWPRFTPAARSGFVFTMQLACAGCNWLCHLPDSYCIKRVRVADVIAAIDELANGSVNRLQIRSLSPDAVLAAQIVREASSCALEHRHQSAKRQHELATEIERQRLTGASERALLDQAQQERTRLAAELAAATTECTRLAVQAAEAEVQIVELRRTETQLRAESLGLAQDAVSQKVELEQNVARLHAECEELRRAVAMEKLRLEQAGQETAAAMRASAASHETEVTDLRARLEQADREHAEAMRASAALHEAELTDLRARIEQTAREHAEAMRASVALHEAELTDLRARMENAAQEHTLAIQEGAVTTASRELELADLGARLEQLTQELEGDRAERRRLNSHLQVELRHQQLQMIDDERALAEKDREKQHLVDILFDLRCQLETRRNGHPEAAQAPVAVAAVSSIELTAVPETPVELSLGQAFAVAAHRISTARGHRMRELVTLTSAALGMFSRRLAMAASKGLRE